mgnify:CR=1 FL=1
MIGGIHQKRQRYVKNLLDLPLITLKGGGLRIDPGGTDGRMGQRTAAAIRRFQKSAGLPEDGRPGQALLERLRAAPTPR